ncbi:MAG: hypothetical protein J7480_03185 [Microbacteriaceae bacterium]|nr:hypothetical protein [Microbacteriaceae bacterium]
MGASIVGTWETTQKTLLGEMTGLTRFWEENGVLHAQNLTEAKGVEGMEIVSIQQLAPNHYLLTTRITKPLAVTVPINYYIDGDRLTGSAKVKFLPESTITGRRVPDASPTVPVT